MLIESLINLETIILADDLNIKIESEKNEKLVVLNIDELLLKEDELIPVPVLQS